MSKYLSSCGGKTPKKISLGWSLHEKWRHLTIKSAKGRFFIHVIGSLSTHHTIFSLISIVSIDFLH